MDFSQAVPLSLIIETIAGIFVFVALGVIAVKQAKKLKETK